MKRLFNLTSYTTRIIKKNCLELKHDGDRSTSVPWFNPNLMILYSIYPNMLFRYINFT